MDKMYVFNKINDKQKNIIQFNKMKCKGQSIITIIEKK